MPATTTPAGDDSKWHSTVGPYKAFQVHKVQYETELKGTDGFAAAQYPQYLPAWGSRKNVRYEPLLPFEHHDPGKNADPALPNLLRRGVQVKPITGSIGAEVSGVQLSQLDDTGKNELALLVAQKKVVAFRNQDFKDLPIQEAVEYARYFGKLHIHPTSGAPAGFPEVHLVHLGANDESFKNLIDTRTNSLAWHSDVTYELQPPGTTFLYALEIPEGGGDTLFVNMVKAYERLSPEFRQRLEGLEAVHSGVEQATAAEQKGSFVRRAPVQTIHPVVRTHPVTGEKALFVNPQFTRRIVQYKQEESDYLLKFLYDHIAFSQDVQARVQWAPGTVVVWDNRTTAHSGTFDWETGERRHLARLAPQAERPQL